jgi:polysaccharide pyruvyl transferase WcaK-like protein
MQPLPSAWLPPSMQTLESKFGSKHVKAQQPHQYAPQGLAQVLSAAKSTFSQASEVQTPKHSSQHSVGPETPSLAPTANISAPSVGSQAAAAESSAADAAANLLIETMDAWETAVTKRLHSAINAAVKGARSDVMQVSTPALFHVSCIGC